MSRYGDGWVGCDPRGGGVRIGGDPEGQMGGWVWSDGVHGSISELILLPTDVIEAGCRYFGCSFHICTTE